MYSLKTVKRLGDKKYRTEMGLFIVEGEKNIKELLDSDFSIEEIFGTSAFLDSIIERINAYDERMQTRIEIRETKVDDLEQAGTFISNVTGIAVVHQKELGDDNIALACADENIVLMLDDVRDPGNLGTIIRIADWYGVTHIIASPTTTDFYNPKVIAATMGSFTRVSVAYAPLDTVLAKAQAAHFPVVVADMEGVSTHEGTLPKTGLLLMGSESHGVKKELLHFVTQRVTIPRFGNAESLNVSVATGILLDTMRR